MFNNRKNSTGYVRNNDKNITLDISKTLISDITPITHKNSTSNNLREDQSITKMMDLNTLNN